MLSSLIPQINPALLVTLLVWSLLWKGLAMWVAARKGERIWFLVFLILGTAGLLEIFYLFVLKGKGLKNILDD